MKPPFKRYGAILGIITATVALTSGAFQLVVWAADQTYVRQDALAAEFNRQEVRRLSREINDLELRAKFAKPSPLDAARLEQLKREREEMLKR